MSDKCVRCFEIATEYCDLCGESHCVAHHPRDIKWCIECHLIRMIKEADNIVELYEKLIK